MSEETLELAEKIVEGRNLLNDLWQAASDPKQKKKIRRQLDALDEQMLRLISINVKAEGEEYDEAVEALAGANRKIEKAITHLNQLAGAIEAVAAAVDLVSKVAAA